ncbi:hypothetical protein LX32DRAFT_434975 [Colletotrichum zoysiae]|uniref:Uncharacterized protein n=1 Tax=Colletotrichum zoysiae TaxID=1216348 RepID=A0AAD9LYU9_9PEZI|nr:hypothetical protein LX32DRAFT_434975 [Colletotrichum zoysiae]
MGSLTTTFTPPASCTNTGIVEIRTPVGTDNFRNYFLQGQNVKSIECFPRNYQPSRAAYYEPGICPSGYTTACAVVTTLDGNVETSVTCCPTMLSCQTDTVLALFPWQSTLVCQSAITTNGDGSWTIGPVTRSAGRRTEFLTGIGVGGAINAYGIQFKVRDGAFPTTSTTIGSVSSPSTVQGVSATAIRTGEPGQSEGEAAKGLSAGAATGIGVGAGAAVILAALAGLWLLRRRRKDKLAAASEKQAAQPGAGQGESPAELRQPFIGHEVAGDNRHSHKPENLPLELDATTGR